MDQVTADDLRSVGGKTYNCARLKQAGFPVPDGVAVPVDVVDADIRALPADSWFDALPAGARFAVRSSGVGEDSAGHSFAGAHESQLNVERAELAEAVVLCRRSASSTQARAYCDARQLADGDRAIGVLVQRMVPAVTSGVAFTINPITGADEVDGLPRVPSSGISRPGIPGNASITIGVQQTGVRMRRHRNVYARYIGGAHSIWLNPGTRRMASVPRHREIKESTARAICKQLEIPRP